MKIHKIAILFIFAILTTSNAFSDCGSPPLPACVGDNDPDIPGLNCCDDVNVPFDGGVSLLIAAGLSAGGYSFFKKKKKAE